MNIQIYALKDGDKYGYVGQSSNPERRLKQHLHHAWEDRDGGCARWLRQMLHEGRRPTLEILETCWKTEACARELYWIGQLLRAGHELANLTEKTNSWYNKRRNAEVLGFLLVWLEQGIYWQERNPESASKLLQRIYEWEATLGSHIKGTAERRAFIELNYSGKTGGEGVKQ